MKRIFLSVSLCILLFVGHSQAIFSDKANAGYSRFDKITIGVAASEPQLLHIAAKWLQQDIEAVMGYKPAIVDQPGSYQNLIIIGDKFIAKNLPPNLIKNHWEAFQTNVMANPWISGGHILLIRGSDRRGVAYGVAEISKALGISPWYWWADVPVEKKKELFIINRFVNTDAPKVKYRGIFINDEAPALSGWAKEKFGGFNHLFYEKVFELMLRLKANYLWPAMWGNAFYDDDSLNIKSADAYGIVIGTSHHEPLMRAHDEWRRYGTGKWNYDSNATRLQKFWREGVRRATNEKIISIGMRGDGDEPMTRETATALLERIVKDQREIITEETGKPASETPQLWALYKEVQDYYDKGMRVPDDVTLLLCDDNWGNIRKLPQRNEKPRKGGYGIYYHFDYVGGPRNYKWINTNSLPRVWEQMHLAWEYNARQIWIVNVGDIKPMELPISFFLDYAWNPTAIGPNDINKYTEKWAAQQFGQPFSKRIADILSKYAKYNARRKPELLDEKTFHLTNYNELPQVLHQWIDLNKKTEQIADSLDSKYLDAFYQLVQHPVEASTNLQQLYYFVALNHYFYSVKDTTANEYANEAKAYYEEDSLITRRYHQLNNGKWNHFMDQTHIGYTYWQQPPVQKMPTVYYVSPIEAKPALPLPESKPDRYYPVPKNTSGNIFFQKNNYVSIEAAHYTRIRETNGIHWTIIPDIGRTADGITSFPVTAADQNNLQKGSYLEYEFYGDAGDSVKLMAYFSPTLNFHNKGGLRYAVSIDNEAPQTVTLNANDADVKTWSKWVAENIIIKSTTHRLIKPGKHTIRYYVVSPGIVLQKIVVAYSDLLESYLGPFETLYKK